MREVATVAMVFTGLIGLYFGVGPADMRGAAVFMATVCALAAGVREAYQ